VPAAKPLPGEEVPSPTAAAIQRQSSARKEMAACPATPRRWRD